MTMMEFFGCSFIAFGPALAMFVFTIAQHPLRIIVLIASGFFWLLALLLSSILWYAVVPLRDKLAFGVVFSVLIQELFRFFFYKMLRKADDGLQKVNQTTDSTTSKDISNKNIMAYVSGLGFGIICGAFSLVNVLADMVGPGTIGIHGDSKYFFLTSAFLTLCFILLHTFWGVIFFHALDTKRIVPCSILLSMVVVFHLIASCLTLLNQRTEPLYFVSIIPAYILLFISAVVAFFIAGGSLSNVKLALQCRKGRYEMD